MNLLNFFRKDFSWERLKTPFFILAPMHEVTDTAFRQVIARYSKPDAMFTEFVSVDGLTHLKSKEKITDYYLRYSSSERPIIAQIWGSDPEKFYQAAKYITSLGFDGIDINMGCPDKAVVKQGGGAALIKSPELALKIVKATKRGAGKLPVSVKTRIGFDTIETERWIEKLVESKPEAITIHGRTKRELSRVSTHWDEIKIAAKIVKEQGIVAIGNGDIMSLEDGKEKAEKYELDGIMVGRAVIGNPWFFNSEVKYENILSKQKVEAMVFHAKLFEKNFDGVKNINRFKKLIKAYISGFKGASEMRSRSMNAKDFKELESLL